MCANEAKELNIQDEQGAVAKYANYFKNSGITEEAANAAGILARSKGKAGFSIARDAGEKVYAGHRAVFISNEVAMKPLLLAMLTMLTACSAPQDDKPIKPTVHRLDKVEFHRYQISESEYMLLVDIPDRYVDRRCAIYVNESTGTSSNLNCNFDDAGSPLPEGGAE